MPVVASNCFGTVEQVVHGVSGYLYDSGDIEMLSEYLNNLIVDKKLLKSMQKNAVSRQQELSTYSSMLEQYNKIYDQITS